MIARDGLCVASTLVAATAQDFRRAAGLWTDGAARHGGRDACPLPVRLSLGLLALLVVAAVSDGLPVTGFHATA